MNPQLSRPDAEVGRVLDVVAAKVADLVHPRPEDESAEFLRLPKDYQNEELPQIKKHYYGVIIRAIRDDTGVSARDLALAQEIAARRAVEGVPLLLVLQNWQKGLRDLWFQCAAVASDTDARTLPYIGTRLMEIQEELLNAVTRSHNIERESILSGERGSKDLIARRLLGNSDVVTDAERFGVELAEQYLILAVAYADSPSNETPPSGSQVSVRRRIRKILRALDEHQSAYPVLSTLGSSGGYLLIPYAGSPTGPESASRRVLDVINKEAGVRLIAGQSNSADHDLMSEAATLADEVLGVAVASARPPGVYGLRDLALPYQLTRPSPALAHLAGVLQPLRSHPDLLDTLDRYFALDLDRGRTARHLSVHPNTVNNRLHRIAELTGADPSRFDGILLLGAALTARQGLEG
ncbi:PucR family transcriptional regulator [Dietzia psychralcaliphila]|uniref:PucR family transcriptional regulator n=1 Tax=Dietzia psychralcaliphila TaxID=139021 RepID=UPI000D30150B|nr:helix-turn-helix domain-containing protein [Dietzia psychralcaliphila]PTM85279.1 PucR-like helix-turn-helix protein [Dietzia psychralcaliphila]